MKASLSLPIRVVAQYVPAPVSNLYITRYSGNPDGWTTDGLPRQLSIDTLGMKDHPLPPKPPVTKGLPDQIKYMPDVWIKLTRTRQEWLFEVNCLSAYGKIPTGAQLKVAKATWAELFDDGRCFTNGTGTGSRRDYINGTNTTKGDMLFEPLLTGGWKVKSTGKRENISTTYLQYGRKSYPHIEVVCVDPDNLPSPAVFLADDTLWHRPTTIKPDGTRGVFPQFDEKAVIPMFGPKGRAWIWERLLIPS